ncbi:M56 family metallopeptidase [Actinokineospora xionganensis]|uniref:M56 family metallopeptidase n=1 Tax=Actinokineospora xionganensis TaxID=2684470 RepID=A0ABR7L0N1_9PSEU|nr:M56 family metallopeptidase [Actinokineospora xionganensis]MBC6445956.1 M56 family metallopeptidase [Actinokineospora xionganensis]
MTPAVALLAGAIVITLWGHRVLARMLNSRVEPQVALVSWLVLVGCCLLSIGIAVGLVLLPGHGPAHGIMQVIHHCWSHVRPDAMPWYVTVPGVLVSVVVVLAGARVAVAIIGHLRAGRALHRRHVETLRIVARSEPGEYPTMWLDHDEPLAYSVSGRPSMVVATSGLHDRLSRSSVAAVIAHERAHIRGNHHLLVGIAEALAKSLPMLPFARNSPKFVRAMVELSADRSAARRHGAPSVRAALLAMAGVSTPPHVLGMAQDSVTMRLDRLENSDVRKSAGRRRLGASLAGVAVVAASLTISSSVLAAATTVVCPLLSH